MCTDRWQVALQIPREGADYIHRQCRDRRGNPPWGGMKVNPYPVLRPKNNYQVGKIYMTHVTDSIKTI